jgi:hypothetical protein
MSETQPTFTWWQHLKAGSTLTMNHRETLKSVKKRKVYIILRGTGLQLMNEFPEYPSGQEHVGIWFTTTQAA